MSITKIFVSKTPNHIQHSIKNLLELCSDHSLLLLKLDTSVPYRVNNLFLADIKINWLKFQHNIFKKNYFKTYYASIIREKDILPVNQFGFHCKRYSTIHQIHHLVDLISLSLEKKSSTVFLDV